MRKVFLIFAGIFLLVCSFAYAYSDIDSPIECNGDEIEYFEADKKIVASGNVVVTYKDMRLTGDEVIVWPQIKKAQASGNVKLVQGLSIFEGDSVDYDFLNNIGSVLNVKAVTEPWYSAGEKASRDGKESYKIENGALTTCDLERPHWRITTKKVLIYPDKKVTAENAVVWIGDIPVMWIPYYCHPLDDDRPQVTVIPGHDSDWGNYLLTAWRYNLTPNQKGYVKMDYRERKDFASGIDYYYKSDWFGKGVINSYYMNERAIDRKHIWYDQNKEDAPTEEEEKGLLRIRHNWQISPSNMLTAELHKYKDEDFIKDYFFKEYEKDEEPETYMLLTNTSDYANLSFLVKKRVNRFDDTIERLPEAKLDVYNTRLFESNFYYKGTFSGVNLNKKYSSFTDEFPGAVAEDSQNNRYDAYNQVSYNTKLGFINFNPYAGTRQTFFERELAGDNPSIRGAFYTGLDISTKFYKVFNVVTDLFCMEINKLRHIVTPTISYDYISLPTLRKEKIFNFDEIDSIDRQNIITLVLENKLQTKRGMDLRSVDLAALIMQTQYDFKKDPGGQLLDYEAKFEFNPYDWLTVASDAVFDPHLRKEHDYLKELNNDLYLTKKDEWRAGIGHRYTQDEQSMVIETLLNFIPGWRFKIYEDFRFKGFQGSQKKIRDIREQEYVITRDLHCWEMDILYNVERGEGETFMIVFRLKAFPGIPFEFGKGYHRPKFGSQSY